MGVHTGPHLRRRALALICCISLASRVPRCRPSAVGYRLLFFRLNTIFDVLFQGFFVVFFCQEWQMSVMNILSHSGLCDI